MKKPLGFLSVLLVLIMLFPLPGCTKPEKAIESNRTGTTCANITMGKGLFACRDGFIYIADSPAILEYDIAFGKTVTLGNGFRSPKGLILSDEWIYYTPSFGGSLESVTRDGKHQSTVFTHEGGCTYLYADGADAYFLNRIGETLYHANLDTGEVTALLENVNHYDMDGTYLYAVTTGESKRLFRISKQTRRCEEIPLSFGPIGVIVSGEDLYLCSTYTQAEYAETGLRYQIIRYADGKEEPLPVYGDRYQVLNGSVIYLAENPLEDGFDHPSLMCYDLQTGQKTLLCESAGDFCILEQRYVCYENIVDGRPLPTLYDFQTGETISIPEG